MFKINKLKIKKIRYYINVFITAIFVFNMSYLGVFFVANEAKAFGAIDLTSFVKLSGENYTVSGTWAPQGGVCTNYKVQIQNNAQVIAEIDPAPFSSTGQGNNCTPEGWSTNITLAAGSHNICAVLIHSQNSGNDQNTSDCIDMNTGGGTISGYKYETLVNPYNSDDLNPGSGWTIFLDTNNDGVLDGGEVSTVTGSDGFYSFSNLVNGTYTLAELTNGWTQLVSPGPVSITSGTISTGNNFVNYYNPIPLSVNFTATTTDECLAEGANVSFDFTSIVSGGAIPYTYSWDFNEDGSEDSNAQNPTYAFSLAGSYDVVLTVTDNDDNTASSTHEIVINECLTYYWEYSEWSECDANCGSGQQTRSATCKDSNGDIVSVDNCSSIKQDDLTRACPDLPACTSTHTCNSEVLVSNSVFWGSGTTSYSYGITCTTADSVATCSSWNPEKDNNPQYSASSPNIDNCTFRCIDGYGFSDGECIELETCGNGELDSGEQCDDGNNNDGDGCSATCQWEIRNMDCSDKIENSVWVTPSNYTQTCGGQTSEGDLQCNVWSPTFTTSYYNELSIDACQYECASGYYLEEGSCVANPIFDRSAEISAPSEGEVVSGVIDLLATLNDEDGDDDVQWAVRKGTCEEGTDTVFGNVDGFNNSFTWDGYNFSSTADTSLWENGEYCFVFNPTESSGDDPIRETRNFIVDNEEEEPEEPSYAWELTDWSECSVACGGGIQTREWICEETIVTITGTTTTVVDGEYCGKNLIADIDEGGEGYEALERECNTQACSSGGSSTFSSGSGSSTFSPFTISNTQVAMQCVNGKVNMDVSWITSQPSDSRVVYDTTSYASGSLGVAPNYSYTYSTALDSAQVTGHSVSINGLEPETIYYFRPISTYNFSEIVGEEKPLTQTLSCEGDSDEIIVLGEEGAPELTLVNKTLVAFTNPGAKNVPFELSVTNNGDITSYDTILTNTLPDGLTYSDLGGHVWDWYIGDIEPGETKTMIIKADIAPGANPGNYINSALVSSSNHDPVLAEANLDVRLIAVLAETGFNIIELGFLMSILAAVFGLKTLFKRKLEINA